MSYSRRTLFSKQATSCYALAFLALASALHWYPSQGSRALAAQQPASQGDLARAAALVDSEQPLAALEILDRYLDKKPKDAAALFLRSTARFMLGELASGQRDLERSLELDPGNRQAWLNMAALQLAQEDHSRALEAFGKAEALDPEAIDNSLNIGTVLLLLKRFDDADRRFATYLARKPGDAQAKYLVASNYAMTGLVDAAIAYLRQAIALDERVRRQARTDPNFASLEAVAAFQRVLNTDTFRHPPGTLRSQQTFAEPYLGEQSVVLGAVISSLQLAGRAFDPQVEVANAWALLWSDIRIKVEDNGNGGTDLEFSAPPGRFQPAQWQAVTAELFRSVTVQLHTRNRAATGPGR